MGPEVERLALGPAGGETAAAGIGLDVEVEIAMDEADGVDASDLTDE